MATINKIRIALVGESLSLVNGYNEEERWRRENDKKYSRENFKDGFKTKIWKIFLVLIGQLSYLQDFSSRLETEEKCGISLTRNSLIKLPFLDDVIETTQPK